MNQCCRVQVTSTLTSLQDLCKCGLVTLIGFSCLLSARVCKGKSSSCGSTFERTIWPDINSTLHSYIVIAAARTVELSMIWPLWFLTLKSDWKKSRKKSICEWLSRAVGCNTSYSEHVLKREHDVQIHVQLLPVTLKQSLISSVCCRESVYVETQPWTFLIHLQ